MSDELYIIFDGPPGPDGPRFIEVETSAGESVRSDTFKWVEDTFQSKGYYKLGPFREVEESVA